MLALIYKRPALTNNPTALNQLRILCGDT